MHAVREIKINVKEILFFKRQIILINCFRNAQLRESVFWLDKNRGVGKYRGLDISER